MGELIDQQELTRRASREVELRILERQFVADLVKHPEQPAPALTAALDQYLAAERTKAGVYHELVQQIAERTWADLVAEGVIDQAFECGVCLVKGWRSHE